MGILNLFKKKPEKQTLKFEDLNEFIVNKKEQLASQEKSIILTIEQELHDLINRFNENLVILKKVDLKDKKVEDRVKFIVRENFEKYLIQFEKLIKTLESLEIKNYEESIANLNHIFADFEKRTFLNFEKSTFLIGKELGAVKDSISEFFNNINKTLKEKNEFVGTYHAVDFANKKFLDITALEETKKEINKSIEENKKKIKSFKQEEKYNQDNILKIKESSEYKSELAGETELEKQNSILEKEIYAVKQSIDFKFLSTIFHSNDKYMRIINNNKNNFKEYILRAPEDLIKILDEAGLVSENSKIKSLVEKNKEFEKLKHKTSKKEIKKIDSIENYIKTLLSDIDLSNEEIVKENKRLEKLDENKNQIIESIKNQLEKININLV
ncbi:MAG: hypothetical protein WC979_06680 [Candidatus Pacearchaeota archaeon]|jgi:hypothetical protein